MNVKQLVKEKAVRIVTMQHLLNWYKEIVHWQQHGSVLIETNRGWIKWFMDRHQKRVESIIPSLNELNLKYYKSKDGIMLTAPDGKWILKETVDEKDYQEELKTIMEETVEL